MQVIDFSIIIKHHVETDCIEYCNEDTFTADCSQFNPDQQNSAQQHNLQQLYLQYDQQFQQQPHFSLPYNYDQHKQINKQNALQQHYVILIKNALYGRMKVGECVKKGMGYVGCFSNITSALHRKCSGLKYCFLRVNDETLQLNQPCDYELKNYLDVDYTCIPGKSLSDSFRLRWFFGLIIEALWLFLRVVETIC